MGKVKKSSEKHSLRHDPLDRQISEDRYAQASSRNKFRGKQSKHSEFVENRLSNQILQQARRQQQSYLQDSSFLSPHTRHTCLSPTDISGIDVEDSNLESDSESESGGENEIPMIDKEDEEALASFMVKGNKRKTTLAEIIKEKLTEKKTEISTIYTDIGSVCDEPINQETELRFKQLVPVLRDYRSGKLPKAFKAIPRFCNWEQVVLATEPEKWSAATMYEATRMFASNLQDKMAQRFYNLVLLPRIRDDIAESKKLNDHLYNALKKTLFKPAAFFKGIIIPLCHARDCTYREATIIGSVLAKYSIPVLHSSAALLTIAEMQYNGVESIFMRILLEKKYALPHRVVNAIVKHFVSFTPDTREFPLLWHQCLLTFVQVYKIDLSSKQKEDLLKLVTVHNHKHVTPEIRKELMERGEDTDVVQQLWKI